MLNVFRQWQRPKEKKNRNAAVRKTMSLRLVCPFMARWDLRISLVLIGPMSPSTPVGRLPVYLVSAYATSDNPFFFIHFVEEKQKFSSGLSLVMAFRNFHSICESLKFSVRQLESSSVSRVGHLFCLLSLSEFSPQTHQPLFAISAARPQQVNLISSYVFDDYRTIHSWRGLFNPNRSSTKQTTKITRNFLFYWRIRNCIIQKEKQKKKRGYLKLITHNEVA